MKAIQEGTPEFDAVKTEWKEKARACTLETLPSFLKELTEDYRHDYGTICHASAFAAIAAASAVDRSEQGGITGFQAGAIMWQFIRNWSYTSNKTGLRIVDYDNFLYPQHAYKYNKTITPSTWEALQKEAAVKLAEADAKYAQYLLDKAQYEIGIAAFVAEYPDYYENRKHYDLLGMGTGAEWEAEAVKKASGFKFAPQEPYEPINGESRVYQHWRSIVAGVVPFGYTVAED